MFQRFSQDAASSGENRGLGLGLAICKHLIELHGGSITASNQRSVGCLRLLLRLQLGAKIGSLASAPVRSTSRKTRRPKGTCRDNLGAD